MARFIITTKHTRSSNGIHIEPGIDIKKAGCLNMVELDVRQV